MKRGMEREQVDSARTLLQTSQVEETEVMSPLAISDLDVLLFRADRFELLNLNQIDMKMSVKEWYCKIKDLYGDSILKERFFPSLDVERTNLPYKRLGFVNFGNICYLNAIIQSLLPLSPFWALVCRKGIRLQSVRPLWKTMKLIALYSFPGIDEEDTSSCMISHHTAALSSLPFIGSNSEAMPLSDSLHSLEITERGKEKHSHRLHAPASSTSSHLDLKLILHELIADWESHHAAESPGAQQDAAEFLTYILNGLSDECKWLRGNSSAETDDIDSFVEVGRKNRTIKQISHGFQYESLITRLFGGVFRTIYMDHKGHKQSQAFEPFLILDVSLTANDRSLVGALRRQFVAEVLSPSISANSSRKRGHEHFSQKAKNASISQQKVKSQLCLLEKLPYILIIALKRFAFDKRSGMSKKLTHDIQFEENLAIEPQWCSTTAAVDLHSPEDYRDPNQLMSANYELRSVVCHRGHSTEKGHYQAYVKNIDNLPKEQNSKTDAIASKSVHINPKYAESGNISPSRWFLVDDTVWYPKRFHDVKKADNGYLFLYVNRASHIALVP
ncbi:ubiquitin carboxyl-terminal hydrolase [Cardiosporidium cionae]|uniref:Ubiquitin carboxyl-terminal hydrolase n=1 Tax=Cardiosporidium cionae TaxID=476202 RepID=A0ABQ7J953_9APIC|nr:ubiquitin carboxyl-terminal hydrolase [Cardiosporidium cionae]|eukprot:KAF8820489.1 ubiquitin carboxyl-terminal hydrolase [Cardiosporidium cionae]